MTLSQRDFINPETGLERKQEFNQSLVCKACVNHAYVGSKNHRVCNKHDLLENEMAICSDFRTKDRRQQLEALFRKS
jgi:hypothetical protein